MVWIMTGTDKMTGHYNYLLHMPDISDPENQWKITLNQGYAAD